MKKGILLTLLAIVLLGIIIYGVWYINRRGELESNSKNSFVPNNSALVININTKASLSSKLQTSFAADIRKFQLTLLGKIVDTLGKANYVSSGSSQVIAIRQEGKNKIVSLFVMDNKDVLAGGEVVGFLRRAFFDQEGRERKYDQYRIYSLKVGEEEIYYSIEEGMILVSDSELYIEDALKQFGMQEDGEPGNAKYKSINKYFSAGAGINIFLNTGCFVDLLPRFIDTEKVFRNMDITKCFKWGALDGELTEEGIGLNGFLSYAGQEASFVKTLEGQNPKEAGIDEIVPANAQSLFLFNLSDLKGYFSLLEKYRYNAGLIDGVRKRQQLCSQMLGSTAESDLKELLQGEFALVNLAYNQEKQESDGVIIVGLKSGSLCKTWVERVIQNHARYCNVHPDSYSENYRVDRDKAYVYYRFPVADWMSVFGGHFFDGVKSNYVMVVDNYLILASSEKALTDFIKNQVHRSFIKDMDWYKKLRGKLSARYNVAYFARTTELMPYYQDIAKEDFKKYLGANSSRLRALGAYGMVWSHEGGMLYNNMYWSVEEIKTDEHPHISWQTKLDVKISMKPVSVVNHNTGEQEVLVQDRNNTVYLVNDAGRILWKMALNESINSEVYQVDIYKNEKLQYLFSTASAMYVVDRNGENVPGFPLKFQTTCEQGITMFDYDKDKTYRIFAPCTDREVYLYDIKGKIVEGWKSNKADKTIVTKVKHFRVGGKDYIVYADSYRFYILDRKGNERVRVSNVLDLKDSTELFLTTKKGNQMIAFADRKGLVYLVNFNGNVQTVNCNEFSADYCLNVEDVDGDRIDDFIFTDEGHLMIYNQQGKMLCDKALGTGGLGTPYVYRFSEKDIRIGLLDGVQHQMILWSLKDGVSSGFPISGDSPFSIVWGNSGDFYLYADAGDGNFIKYQVQRTGGK